MADNNVHKIDSTELRRLAKERLRDETVTKQPLETEGDPLKLIHELQVHQIQLEMQNEELRKAIYNREMTEKLLGKYTDLYDFNPAGYMTLDPNGNIRTVNLTCAGFLGIERSLLIGRRLALYLSPDTRPVFYDFLIKVFASDKKETCEVVLLKGRESKLFVQIEAVVCESREECRIVVIDITERKQTEAKLQMEQDLYKDLVNTIAVGTYRLRVIPAAKWNEDNWRSQMETHYSVDMVSDRFCEITGIDKQEFEANPKLVPDRIHPDDSLDFIRTNAEAVDSFSVFSWEGRMLHSDKGTIWAHFESIPRLLKNREVIWTGIVYDISERKKAEKVLKDKNTELERFTYTVSHDLKSPLITIQSYAGMIIDDLKSGQHSRIPEDLQRIADASTKMGMLLDDLLKLSRIGWKMNPPSQVDMERLVKDVLEQLEGPLKKGQVEIAVHSNLPRVLGDQWRISEVLQNLVENAIKYMGDQNAPRIEIGVREGNNEIVFFVSDNGKGIDPQYFENIFDLFNKLDDKSEGSGVGLALVKRIIELHDGRVWVESEGVGKGSIFCFSIPTAT